MKVIFYTTGCPACLAMEKLLKKHNISYEEVDDVDQMLALGMTHVPMLNINGTLMNFGEAKHFIEEEQRK